MRRHFITTDSFWFVMPKRSMPTMRKRGNITGLVRESGVGREAAGGPGLREWQFFGLFHPRAAGQDSAHSGQRLTFRFAPIFAVPRRSGPVLKWPFVESTVCI